MKQYHVAIIGMGPRGLNILERIGAILGSQITQFEIIIHLINPTETGQGTHLVNQPDYLLVNTIAGQITMFSDETVTNAGPIVKGLSLLEWSVKEGYRVINDSYVKASQEGRAVNENDYLSRGILGEYLTYVFDRIVSSFPSHIKLHHYRQVAENIIKRPDGRIDVILEKGYRLTLDFVFLTTGHSENKPNSKDQELQEQVLTYGRSNCHLSYIRNPYPTAKLASISPEATVAIQGMGLTAYDIIAELTVGRGGKFIPVSADCLQYHPSGREPQIILYSRQSLPFAARGINQKGIGGQYQANFFTRQRIEQLRLEVLQNYGRNQLDFTAELFPLLKQEMCYVYHNTCNPDVLLSPDQYIPSAEDKEAIESILYPLKNIEFENYNSFQEFILQFLETDIENSFEGNVKNPVKAATDVIRDIRDNLRYAVEFGGLTPESHEAFLKTFCPIMNRIAVGPPKERNLQLIALLKAGIITFGPGSNPILGFSQEHSQFSLTSTTLKTPIVQRFDVLIRAKVDSFYPSQEQSQLFQNLLKSGLVTLYQNGNYHPGGITINSFQNIIDSEGNVLKNIWALGNPAEGPNFYTYILPRPLVNSRAIQDAGRCVLAMLKQIEIEHTQNVNFKLPALA